MNPTLPTTIAQTAFGLDSTTWTAISAAATVVYCVLVAVTLWVLRRQTQHMKQATEAQAFGKALDVLQQPYVRDARKAVFELAQTPFEKWTADNRENASVVCHTYDQVGIMTAAKLFPTLWIVDNWGDSLRRLWPILQPLVAEQRRERSPRFWNDFERLARQAQQLHDQEKSS